MARIRHARRTPGSATRTRPYPTPSSIGSTRRKLFGRAAVALGNKLYPGLGTAGKLVYSASKYMKPGTRKRNGLKVRKSSKMGVYHTKGSFGGKFNTKKEKNQFVTHSNKGTYHVAEVHGTVSDPDCVYLSHCAIDSYAVIIHATSALMRKLFEKAGVNVTNVEDILGHVSIADGANWKIELTQIDELTGVESVRVSHITIAASTLATVTNAFFPAFQDFSAGQGVVSGGLGNRLRLYRLILYTQDFNTTYSPTFFTSLNLEDEVICVLGKSAIKLQNRTLAADGSSSKEDISNNPLMGRMYEFPNYPKGRDRLLYGLNSILANEGINLVRSAQIPSLSYKEPPLPNHFANCKKSSLIKLEPGEIKYATVSYEKHMHLLTFLSKIKMQMTDGTARFLEAPFPCQLFSLEDMINVNTTQNISIAYEVNKELGIYFKTQKSRRAVTTFQQASISNNP